MAALSIDQDYLLKQLEQLLLIPSPSGMTDEIVRHTCQELDRLQIHYELTRRGAIRATLPGKEESPRRAVAAHLDTLGAMVKSLKRNGRLRVVPIGHWNARFAEGARVRVHLDGAKTFTGTILPLKASGHTYNEEVDSQDSSWANLELRIDHPCSSIDELWDVGFRVGNFVSIEAMPEFHDNGFINSRHLDDKCGVASMLAAAKAIKDAGVVPALDCHLLFTISEEVGVGASHVLHGDVAEMLSVDNGTIAPGQNTCDFGVTIAMMDSTGPFDRHLTRHLIDLCIRHEIEFSRDVFMYYRSDAAAALEAGNDIRTGLVCFALDASHGWERTHARSLMSLASLLGNYILSKPLFAAEENVIGPITEFPMIERHQDQDPVD